MLGWNPGTEEEILSPNELIEKFDLAQVQKKGAVWDEKKLHWVSGQHVMNKSTGFLLDAIREIHPDWGKGSDISFLISILELLKVRAKSLTEFIRQSEYFFYAPKEYDRAGLKKWWKNESVNERITAFLEHMDKVPNWRKEDLETSFKSFAESIEMGLGKIIMPVRMAVCGSPNGPSIFAILELLGRDTTIGRIETALEKLPN